jgi:HlyD family secretion protein
MDDINRLAPPPAAIAPDRELVERLRLGKPPHGIRWFAAMAVAGLVVVVIGLWMMRPPAPENYLTQSLRIGPLSVSVSATGTVAPRDQVDVGAEVSGRIDTVLFDFNDHVRKGQVLAQINRDQIGAQLRQARASQLQAGATVKQTEKTLERTRRLAADQALSQQALEAAIADRDRAQAALAQADAQVAQLQTQYSKTTIRSPIDGVVLDRRIEPGQTVVASLQAPVLFTLASDLARMELDVDIDEADVGQVKDGQPVVFSVDSYPGRKFNGRLVSVHNSSKTVNGVVTYQGVIWVENAEGLLRPGMTATADIQTANTENALLVPNAALRFSPGAPSVNGGATVQDSQHGRVWVLRKGKPQPRDIRLGLTDGKETQVLESPLFEEDAVITGTGTSLNPATAGATPR